LDSLRLKASATEIACNDVLNNGMGSGSFSKNQWESDLLSLLRKEIFEFAKKDMGGGFIF